MMTEEGTRSIIVAVKHLGRWLIAKAVPSQTTDVVLRFSVESIVANFGKERTSLSAQGPAFTSRA